MSPIEERGPSAPLRIVRARSPRALREFLEFPYRQYARDAQWVPPLRRDQRVLLDRMRHPVHQHLEVEYFLARRAGQTVGRIAAIENFAHNVFHAEKAGFFGFLDAVEDTRVFDRLLNAAVVWCRSRRLKTLRGPCSFSTNEECGQLIENYSSRPVVMTSYHPPYYPEQIEACGFRRAEDMIYYWMTWYSIPERVERLASAAVRRLERRGQRLEIRPLDKADWANEVNRVKAVYNEAWEKNWGFVPMTDAEMDFVAKELRPIVDPGLVRFAEVDGEIAGFTFALPDYNLLLKHMNGRLNPMSLLKVALLRKSIHQLRILMMGVLPAYRQKGIEIVMYRDFARYAMPKGYLAGEMSWILDRNEPMKHQIESFGGVPYKRYRIYEKPL